MDLVAEVYNEVWHYLGLEMAGKNDPQIIGDLLLTSKLRFLYSRGDSYQEHHLDLVRGLFEVHNPFLKQKFGFKIQEMIDGVHEVVNQIEVNFNRHQTIMRKMYESHDLFKNFMAGKDENNMADAVEEFKASPEIREKYLELEALSENQPYLPFEIRPNERLSKNILKTVSSSFGDNSDFLSFLGAPGWPTNDSIIHAKPLINYNGTYYCFLPQLLFRNIIIILEEAIKEKDEKYFHSNYQKKRSEYLEKKALEYFARLLPGAKIFKQLYYCNKKK